MCNEAASISERVQVQPGTYAVDPVLVIDRIVVGSGTASFDGDKRAGDTVAE